GEVKRVADFLNSYQDVTVEIEGHTDAQGAEAYNQTLSQRRADSVKKALVTRYGIAAERVKAIGYGESRPVASNDTAAGRAENRRVVAVMQKEVLE
ncbi:OmpA family protein, partial [Arthrospira platensis SPKY1]|nr:OmpA family protein [Arthrospira platensis SPKY1]